MERDLPHSRVLVIVRHDSVIVGVGAIKPVRRKYAEGIAAKSHFPFPSDTPELGYVAVAEAHQGHGLSNRITDLLVSQVTGRLFSTTDSPKMKKTLGRAGFLKK